jgi:type IV pilus assembly protein PilA
VLQHLKERRQSEEGFTLIELMVVVLIMGILMAIAIPTFLATRGSANDASAKSNATNAFTNEKSYYASNQQFLDAPDATNGTTLDDTLPWAAKGTAAYGLKEGEVQAIAYSAISPSLTEGNGQAVVIVAYSKSGNCYYIADNEASTTSAYIGYAVSQNNTSACPAATGVPTATTSGTASANPLAAGTGPSSATWYASW